MTDRENNAKMQLTIDTKVVGSKVAGFSINGRSVVIAFDSGYTASFDVVENFDLIGPGKWVFVPNSSPGRPPAVASRFCPECGVVYLPNDFLGFKADHGPGCTRPDTKGVR